MCDSRLSNIALLSIESARSQSIKLHNFVDEFDCRHENRKSLIIVHSFGSALFRVTVLRRKRGHNRCSSSPVKLA